VPAPSIIESAEQRGLDLSVDWHAPAIVKTKEQAICLLVKEARVWRLTGGGNPE